MRERGEVHAQAGLDILKSTAATAKPGVQQGGREGGQGGAGQADAVPVRSSPPPGKGWKRNARYADTPHCTGEPPAERREKTAAGRKEGRAELLPKTKGEGKGAGEGGRRRKRKVSVAAAYAGGARQGKRKREASSSLMSPRMSTSEQASYSTLPPARRQAGRSKVERGPGLASLGWARWTGRGG